MIIVLLRPTLGTITPSQEEAPSSSDETKGASQE